MNEKNMSTTCILIMDWLKIFESNLNKIAYHSVTLNWMASDFEKLDVTFERKNIMNKNDSIRNNETKIV